MSCARCGEIAYGETTLIGGYIATLCQRCKNQWGKEILQSSLYEELCKVRTAWALAIHSNTYDKAQKQVDEILRIEREFYKIGEEWCNENSECSSDG